MMSGHLLTGGLIVVIGIIFVLFLLVKLIPRMRKDSDAVILSGVYLVIGIGLVVMGSFIGLSGLSSLAMGCWL